MEGYKGAGLELLERFGAKVGDRVQVETFDGSEVTGLLIPRYEYADNDHIVLNSESGTSDQRRLQFER